jgi:hypothetical protein
MNAQEATALCRLVKAACPQQAIDPMTPDLWATLLGDLRWDDAREAVIALAQRQPFISPAEIRAEVRRVRGDRIASAPAVQPPADLDPDDTAAYHRWLRDSRRQAADGNVIPFPELPARRMPALGRVFRHPDDVPDDRDNLAGDA